MRTRVVFQQQILDQISKYFGNILLTDFNVLVNELETFFDLPPDDIRFLLQPLLLLVLGLLRAKDNRIDIKREMYIVEVGEHFFVDKKMVEEFYRFNSQIVLLVLHPKYQYRYTVGDGSEVLRSNLR